MGGVLLGLSDGVLSATVVYFGAAVGAQVIAKLFGISIRWSPNTRAALHHHRKRYLAGLWTALLIYFVVSGVVGWPAKPGYAGAFGSLLIVEVLLGSRDRKIPLFPKKPKARRADAFFDFGVERLKRALTGHSSPLRFTATSLSGITAKSRSRRVRVVRCGYRRTTSGTPCRNRVRTPGQRCHLHV